MIDYSFNLIPLLLFAFSATLTPGPNNLMVMNSGLNFGTRKSLPHFYGICVGFPLMFLIVALGFGVIFEKNLWIKDILKVIGSAYMLYLAYSILRAHSPSFKERKVKPFTFTQAMLFQWMNPKAWLMAISAISTYALSTNYFYSAIFMSAIFLLMSLPCVGIWLFLGTKLQHVLMNPRYYRIFNVIMATALIASIAMIYIEN